MELVTPDEVRKGFLTQYGKLRDRLKKVTNDDQIYNLVKELPESEQGHFQENMQIYKELVKQGNDLMNFLEVPAITVLSGIKEMEKYRRAFDVTKPVYSKQDEKGTINLIRLLRKGNVQEFNQLRLQSNVSPLDLSDVNLPDANLSGFDLSQVILRRAILTNANLSGATLTDATLTNANLSGANISRANISRDNRSGAPLSTAQEQEESPYVGPRPFKRILDDQKRFFGRDEETKQIISLIHDHQLVLVYGRLGDHQSKSHM